MTNISFFDSLQNSKSNNLTFHTADQNNCFNELYNADLSGISNGRVGVENGFGKKVAASVLGSLLAYYGAGHLPSANVVRGAFGMRDNQTTEQSGINKNAVHDLNVVGWIRNNYPDLLKVNSNFLATIKKKITDNPDATDRYLAAVTAGGEAEAMADWAAEQTGDASLKTLWGLIKENTELVRQVKGANEEGGRDFDRFISMTPDQIGLAIECISPENAFTK